MTDFRPSLNPSLDVAALARSYREDGHVRIPDLLDPISADVLERSLLSAADWMQMINSGDKLFELSREVRASFDDARRAALAAAVERGARWGFQHRYEALRVADDPTQRAAAGRPLDLFASFMNSGPMSAFLRAVTGETHIDIVDAQATLYGPGDFLTCHDDAVAGKGRLAAYVYGLTRQWRPDWGGLLFFHMPDGVVRGLQPGFNTLHLFAVPQPHSVSMVTSSAPVSRLSVTGWLRKC